MNVKKDIKINQNIPKEGHSRKKTKISHLKTKENIRNKKMLVEKWLTKTSITYLILFLLDIILVIYSARQNIVNYVTVSGENIFVSKTRYLLLGRNYINLIIIVFFYIYTCLVNRFFLKNNNTKKFLGWLFVCLTLLNLILFFIFTKRVY